MVMTLFGLLLLLLLLLSALSLLWSPAAGTPETALFFTGAAHTSSLVSTTTTRGLTWLLRLVSYSKQAAATHCLLQILQSVSGGQSLMMVNA
jgi:hypothetical protein